MVTNKEARERSAQGYSRILQTEREENVPDPRNAGSTGFPLAQRESILQHALETSDEQAAAKFNVSTRTIRRWRVRITPYRQTGNNPREVLVGFDQFLLCLAVHIYPRGSSDDYAAFILMWGGS